MCFVLAQSLIIIINEDQPVYIKTDVFALFWDRLKAICKKKTKQTYKIERTIVHVEFSVTLLV